MLGRSSFEFATEVPTKFQAFKMKSRFFLPLEAKLYMTRSLPRGGIGRR